MASHFQSFDEWVHDCFTQEDEEGAEQFSPVNQSNEDQELLLSSTPHMIDTTFLTRLFESPGFVADRYSREQIAACIWYIFGVRSDMMYHVIHSDVPEDLKVRCYQSISTLYTDLFDKVCGIDLDTPDSDPRNGRGIDGAVYMIWDMDRLEIPLYFPSKHPQLVEPSIQILESVLLHCKTTTCLLSALHGIGHACQCDARGGKPEHRVIATRLRSIVDRFLKARQIPKWLKEYAHEAKAGAVL